jgi:hypothetical protein
MARSGVESLRVAFYWRQAQPYPNAAQVPPGLAGRFATGPGGVPTDFHQTDHFVRMAAERRLRLLPTVLYAPQWASARPFDPYYYTLPSSDPTPYTNYLLALIQRYGPSGSFWSSHRRVPRRPIREWQIWNEPNIPNFWQELPYPKPYVRLLSAAYRVVHRTDPGARVVLAGLANDSWNALDALYRAGLRGNFDIAAPHPFTHSLSGVFAILRLNRAVMRRNGDGLKPMYVTELAWSTAKGHIPRSMLAGIEVSKRRQSALLSAAYKGVGARWRRLRVSAVFWHAWATVYARGFTWNYTGLLRSYYARPFFRPLRLLRAYTSAARHLEGCKKSSVATRCARHRRRHR